MTKWTYMTALSLGAALVGCNCGYQSWRRGPACAQPAPVSNCAPVYGAPVETYLDEGTTVTPAPTLRGAPGATPVPQPGPNP